jgi:hypothetical protein
LYFEFWGEVDGLMSNHPKFQNLCTLITKMKRLLASVLLIFLLSSYGNGISVRKSGKHIEGQLQQLVNSVRNLKKDIYAIAEKFFPI